MRERQKGRRRGRADGDRGRGGQGGGDRDMNQRQKDEGEMPRGREREHGEAGLHEPPLSLQEVRAATVTMKLARAECLPHPQPSFIQSSSPVPKSLRPFPREVNCGPERFSSLPAITQRSCETGAGPPPLSLRMRMLRFRKGEGPSQGLTARGAPAFSWLPWEQTPSGSLLLIWSAAPPSTLSTLAPAIDKRCSGAWCFLPEDGSQLGARLPFSGLS